MGFPVSDGAPQRLRIERERLGKSQRAFAELIGISKNSQLAYESGSSPITLDYLARSAEHGLDVGYVATGRREDTDEPIRIIAEELRQRISERIGHDESAGLDLVPVNEIDMAYGLGGTYSDVEVQAHARYFPREWLEQITRTAPVHLAWTRGRGDSMGPTINDGDLILFDLSQKQVKEQDAIWALTIGDIAMIKRLRMKGERVLILSDNDRISPDDVHYGEVNIVGRVVFIGRRI